MSINKSEHVIGNPSDLRLVLYCGGSFPGVCTYTSRNYQYSPKNQNLFNLTII